MDSKQRYMMRGVSAMKEDVHNAIKNIDKGIFPQAFCKIIPDILGGRASLTCIGKRRATSPYGKVLLRMP